MTEYDRDFALPVAFKSEPVGNVLTDVLTGSGIPSVKITQSERFPHLTYFFNGGADTQLENEQHILLPTPRSESVDHQPESQSFKITDRFIQSLDQNRSGVFVVNLPAADLVAGTGQVSKTVEAIQYVDTCIGGIVEHIRNAGGIAILTSSHGNCEEMSDVVTGEPQYLTTSNRVPFHLVADGLNGTTLREGGSLADIAPTILGLLNIEKPSDMTGNDLRKR